VTPSFQETSTIPPRADRPPPPAAQVALALLSVYLIWGSTYLAIALAIETIPPFTMAGVRFVLAGGLLYAFLRMRGAPTPGRGEWLAAGAIGLLLLGGGNGGVTWAEQRVPSGITALILAITPAWMVLFDWLRPGGVRPLGRTALGIVMGLAGIVLLLFFGGELRVEAVDRLGGLVVLGASISWAAGSILSRSLRSPTSPLMATALQMLLAGGFLALLGTLTEWGQVRSMDSPSLLSIAALLYLVVFGSWIGFTAYLWLLERTTPALASTYAYVNPTVALALGWLLAGETLDRWVFAAMALILSGVLLMTRSRS